MDDGILTVALLLFGVLLVLVGVAWWAHLITRPQWNQPVEVAPGVGDLDPPWPDGALDAVLERVNLWPDAEVDWDTVVRESTHRGEFIPHLFHLRTGVALGRARRAQIADRRAKAGLFPPPHPRHTGDQP